MSQVEGGPRRREHVSFFRQSGWLLLATGIAGVCFMMVHTPAGHMSGRTELESRAEYSLFTALLDSLILLGIPALGLQSVFAQLTASAIDETQRLQVRGAVRRVLLLVTVVWALAVLGIWMMRDRVLEGWKIRNPAALWCTLAVGLVGLWTPVFSGLLQGAQRFFWLGNAGIALAAGRLLGVAIAVALLHGLAAGAMAGVLFGACVSLTIAMWASRHEWLGPASPGHAWIWVRPWMALTLGLAAGSVMLSWDTLLVQRFFGDEKKAFYMAAGRVGRGLVALTTPLALVLFPRVARSAVTGEPTGALRLALGATLGTGVMAAIVCTLLPALPVEILYSGNPDFLPAAQLVPWFCWCMLPLTAAYTLVNDLLARRRFAAVPWLLLVAGGYAASLWSLRDTLTALPMFDAFRRVVQVLGGFSLLLLAVAVLFSLRRPAGGKGARPV